MSQPSVATQETDHPDTAGATVTTESETGHVVVVGLGESDVRQAVDLLFAARGIQRELTNSYADVVLAAMTSAHIPAVPGPNSVLAQRRSALRAKLISSGYLSNEDIAALRDTSVSSARTFVARERDKHTLFTVKHGRNVFVPKILLDPDGQLTAVSQAVKTLVPLGLDGWELWSWLATPSGWLSGDIPAAVFETSPERAMAAVRAYADELSVTAQG